MCQPKTKLTKLETLEPRKRKKCCIATELGECKRLLTGSWKCQKPINSTDLLQHRVHLPPFNGESLLNPQLPQTQKEEISLFKVSKNCGEVNAIQYFVNFCLNSENSKNMVGRIKGTSKENKNSLKRQAYKGILHLFSLRNGLRYVCHFRESSGASGL